MQDFLENKHDLKKHKSGFIQSENCQFTYHSTPQLYTFSWIKKRILHSNSWMIILFIKNCSTKHELTTFYYAPRSEVIYLNCLSLHNCRARKFHSQQNMAYSSYVVCHPNDGYNGRYQRAKRRVCLEVKTITQDLQQQFTDTSTGVIKDADRTSSGFAIDEPFRSIMTVFEHGIVATGWYCVQYFGYGN